MNTNARLILLLAAFCFPSTSLAAEFSSVLTLNFLGCSGRTIHGSTSKNQRKANEKVFHIKQVKQVFFINYRIIRNNKALDQTLLYV